MMFINSTELKFSIQCVEGFRFQISKYTSILNYILIHLLGKSCNFGIQGILNVLFPQRGTNAKPRTAITREKSEIICAVPRRNAAIFSNRTIRSSPNKCRSRFKSRVRFLPFLLRTTEFP